MKQEHKILVVSILTAIAFWVTDAIIDTLFFSQESLLDELFKPSAFEIYIRSLSAAFILILGMVISRLNAERRKANGKISHLAALVESSEQDKLIAIGRLALGVAHEINNPLTSVLGFSELLLKRELPDDVRTDLNIINEQGKRVALIVKNLISFADSPPEEKQPIDINESIRVVLTLRGHEQSAAGIQVNTLFANDLPRITGNYSQMKQVFLNIILNAEQAMREAHNKGTLTVKTALAGNMVRASFADDGPGISLENMNKLFTPFFTTKGTGRGTGLGLSICHGIVAEHGGRIYAESEQGKGATFVVELPISQTLKAP